MVGCSMTRYKFAYRFSLTYIVRATVKPQAFIACHTNNSLENHLKTNNWNYIYIV